MKLQDWKSRVWWFDVVYPIALAILLIWSLTSIVFSGSPSSRLSILAETKLLDFSERLADGMLPINPGQILTVTADALEIERLGRAPFGLESDAGLIVYSRIIDELVSKQVPVIFVHWNIKSHLNDETYYSPLQQSLENAERNGVKVYLLINATEDSGLPKSFAEKAKLLDNSSCLEENSLQTHCTYNSTWKEWAFVTIVDEIKPYSEDARRIDSLLSAWLPTNSPGIIVNLSPPKSLNRCSFEQVFAGSCAGLDTQPKVAFVGTNVSGAVRPQETKALPERVRTTYDDRAVDVTASGTPKHEFWALAAQMLIDNRGIRAPSPEVHDVVTVLFCGLVLGLMLVAGGPIALGAFVVLAVSGPIFNALAIRYINGYEPLFNLYYFGLLTFITAGFARLSFTAFRRWRLLEKQRMHSLTADLKSNFVSLLSHNLNTPVAKMQGLLAMLGTQAKDPDTASTVNYLERNVARLEYAIRSVLVASTIEEGAIGEASKSLKALIDEFRQSMLPSLKRFGVVVRAEFAEDSDPDASMLPIRIDVRAFQVGLAAANALFCQENRTATVQMVIVATTNDQGIDLSMRLESSDSRPSVEALEVLGYPEAPTIRSVGSRSFMPEVLAALARLVAETYRGGITTEPGPGSFAVVVQMRLFDAGLQNGTAIAK